MSNEVILVTTSPFSKASQFPRQCLIEAGYDIVENPYGRRLQRGEIGELIEEHQPHGIIAGTEPISDSDLAKGRHLKIIARVGIGLDSVDLNAARSREILVTYTPDAPAPAVAELAVGQAISLLRNVHLLDGDIRSGEWNRLYGRRLADVEVGIIGVGRIGSRVIRRMSGFGKTSFLANDLKVNHELDRTHTISWVDKKQLFKQCEVISIHVPLTKSTHCLISKNEFSMMRSDVVLINTSRGGIVDEDALYDFMSENPDARAAIDVFAEEPYPSDRSNDLRKLQNVVLTPHLGSMTRDCRSRMESEAVESTIAYLSANEVVRSVPESEYQVQRDFRSVSSK